MPATDLLVRMQASHTHLAIVIDEYGGTEGLVSIEDLVEVIVGDISDEHDTDEDLEIAAGERHPAPPSSAAMSHQGSFRDRTKRPLKDQLLAIPTNRDLSSSRS